MVASRATMEAKPAATALELARRMEDMANKEDWTHVEDIAGRLRHVLLQIPQSERRDVLLRLRRSVETVQGLALQARKDVTGRLSAIRRGRDANRAYARATGESFAELR